MSFLRIWQYATLFYSKTTLELLKDFHIFSLLNTYWTHALIAQETVVLGPVQSWSWTVLAPVWGIFWFVVHSQLYFSPTWVSDQASTARIPEESRDTLDGVFLPLP